MNEPAPNRVPPQSDEPVINATSALTHSPPRTSRGRLTNLLLVFAAIVAVSGITFALGRMTAPAQGSTGLSAGQLPGGNGQTLGQAPNGSFAPGGGQVGLGGGMTFSGTVSAINGSTLTLTTTDGRTFSVDLAGTTYHSETHATAADVAVGTSVKVTVDSLGGPGVNPATSGSTTPALTATDVTIVTQ